MIQISPQDKHLLKKFTWYINANGYVEATKTIRKKKHHFLLHRVIMGANGNDPLVDHIDGNKLNNRRSNLRFATLLDNAQNLKNKRKNSSSGFRGVCWDKQKEKFKGYHTFNYKYHHIGYFDSKQEAHRAVLKYRKEMLLG